MLTIQASYGLASINYYIGTGAKTTIIPTFTYT